MIQYFSIFNIDICITSTISKWDIRPHGQFPLSIESFHYACITTFYQYTTISRPLNNTHIALRCVYAICDLLKNGWPFCRRKGGVLGLYDWSEDLLARRAAYPTRYQVAADCSLYLCKPIPPHLALFTKSAWKDKWDNNGLNPIPSQPAPLYGQTQLNEWNINWLEQLSCRTTLLLIGMWLGHEQMMRPPYRVR